MRHLRRFSWVLFLLIGLVLGGCETPRIPGASPELLGFLQVGTTTREQVVLKLGQPSASFEQEHILTYRVGEDKRQGKYIVAPKALMPWERTHYSLVLVFTEDGRLAKMNLVDVQ